MNFSSIANQSETKTHLLDMMRDGRLPHALLLTGASGTGKIALATAVAQYMNCQNPEESESCGKCVHCQRISKGLHPDVHYILPIITLKEGDKQLLTEHFLDTFREPFFEEPYYPFTTWQQALEGENKQLQIGVEEVREAKRKMSLKAFDAPYKVLIVWNIEKMNVSAANAFLKLLEEPPAKTLILMTSSEPSRLLATISSRCQRVPVERYKAAEIAEYLQTKRHLSPKDAESASLVADGSIGQAIAYIEDGGAEMTQLYTEWLRAVFLGDFLKIQKGMEAGKSSGVERIAKENKEFQRNFLNLAIRKIRDSLMFHLEAPQLAHVSPDEQAFHAKFAQQAHPEKVERILTELESTQRYLMGNANAMMALTSLSLRIHGILRGA